MQLTRFTDYSLRVLVNLGLQPGHLVTISEVAGQYAISESHLTKVVNLLAQKGYLETVRGKGGGMRLARRPELINIGDVIRDTEENFEIAECFNSANKNCAMLPSCVLKSVLNQATKNFLATLDEFTLADILPQQTPAWRSVTITHKPEATKTSAPAPDDQL